MLFPDLLHERLVAALAAADVTIPAGVAVEVCASQDARFGDYQSNIAMIAAKAAKVNPRELAGRIVAAFDGSGLCTETTIAGPGFINFRIDPAALAANIAQLAKDPRAGVAATTSPLTIVLDFS